MSNTTKIVAALGVVAGLGVAALPMSSYAATVTDSTDVLVTAEIKDVISLSVDTEKLELGTVIPGGDYKSGDVTATVSMNSDVKTYNLMIQGTNGDTAMSQVDAGGVKLPGAKTIATGTTLSGATSAWAYHTTSGTWTEIPATATSVFGAAHTLATDVTEEATVLSFGVYAANGQEAGTYQGSVTLTATADTTQAGD